MTDAAAIEASEFLEGAVGRARRKFEEDRSLLSYADYLDLVARAPEVHLRDAATYLRDTVAHYGTREMDHAYGRSTRYTLFDREFDGGQPLIGHEPVQEAVFGLLNDFVQEGRTSKLILLHGPNGSAKSSFIACLMAGLEHYSHQPEGVVYSFSWVFPSKTASRGAIGFGATSVTDSTDSFAQLTDDALDARLHNELREHPILLLPRQERARFLERINPDERPLSQLVTHGELGAKNRAIFDALHRAYQGDLGKVLKHVQVERFFISKRYRRAAVTVDPQMRVDAAMRQVTSDRSLASLPPSLQTLTLFEALGDLVDANRGIIEYNDLLKRPIEAFKYLLATCENGTVGLDAMTLYIDTVFIGSSNAVHLNAFMEMPDFASFKGRIELIQVPYLLDYEQERAIYAAQTNGSSIRRPVAPHTDRAAALWAVLTRLEPPLADRYGPTVRKALEQLDPLHKARLYAVGLIPSGLPRDVSNELRKLVPELHAERTSSPRYEGRSGASPRELKAALLSASRRPGYRCLSPLALFDELRELIKQVDVYEFLRIEPQGPYHRPERFIEVVENWYLELVEDELHQAMGLVDAARTTELFTRYIDHVTHYVRKEKRHNSMTGRHEDPDAQLMREVESRLKVAARDADDARAGVMHRIAAWRMENPEGELDFAIIFADHIDRLRDAFYEEKRSVSDHIKRTMLRYLVEPDAEIDSDDLQQVRRTLGSLESDFGYGRECAIDVVGHLLKRSYGSSQRRPRA